MGRQWRIYFNRLRCSCNTIQHNIRYTLRELDWRCDSLILCRNVLRSWRHPGWGINSIEMVQTPGESQVLREENYHMGNHRITDHNVHITKSKRAKAATFFRLYSLICVHDCSSNVASHIRSGALNAPLFLSRKYVIIWIWKQFTSVCPVELTPQFRPHY